MKLTRSGPPLPKHGGKGRIVHTPPRRPQWLQEYIANQGEYVLLSCGHKDNLNDRALLIITRLDLSNPTQVFCERCNSFVSVVRHMKFREYAGIPPTTDTDIPLF